MCRVNLAYGGDDITIVLAALLERSSFPYRDLDLAKAQDWIMLDNLKIRISTLEEVSLTPFAGLRAHFADTGPAPCGKYALGFLQPPAGRAHAEVPVANVRREYSRSSGEALDLKQGGTYG